MRDTPKVSAIVTAYNHEHFIDESIESLLEQKYASLEIIIVDDSSRDSTVARASKYEAHGVRVHLKKNGGPSSAINFGCRLATGDILALQSGDDISLPGRIEAQVEFIQGARTDIVWSVPRLIDDTGATLRNSVFPFFFKKYDVSSPATVFRHLFYDGNFVCAPAVSMTREVWERTGAFHEGLMQLQDYDYWLRAAALECKFGFFKEPLVGYRLHGSNLSSPANQRRADREYSFTLRSIGSKLRSDFLQDVLYGETFSSAPLGVPSRILLPQLYVRHANPSIRQIGFDLLLALLENEGDRALLHEHFAITPRTVSDLLLSADQ